MNTRFLAKVLLTLICVGGLLFATGCSRYHHRPDKGADEQASMTKPGRGEMGRRQRPEAQQPPMIRPVQPGAGRLGMRGMSQDGQMRGRGGPDGQMGQMRGAGMAMRAEAPGLQRFLQPQAVQELGLTDKQVEQIRKIADRTKEQRREMTERRRADQERFRGLMESQNPDSQAIMELIDKQSRDTAAVRKLDVGATLEVRKLLTAEQIEKARQLRRRQDGMGPGRMGRGDEMGAGAQDRPERPIAQQRRERIRGQMGGDASK